MTHQRRRRWTAAATTVLGVSLGTCLRVQWCLRTPGAALPEDRVRLYVSAHCSGSLHAAAQILADDTLSERVLLIPTEGLPAELTAPLCDRTFETARGHRPLLWLSSRAEFCRRLAAAGTFVSKTEFVHQPAWGVGASALPPFPDLTPYGVRVTYDEDKNPVVKPWPPP